MKDFEDKDNDQNNAYILIYKKQNFDIEAIDNISNNYNCNLALPPYDKFSNINNEIKTIINKKMFNIGLYKVLFLLHSKILLLIY